MASLSDLASQPSTSVADDRTVVSGTGLDGIRGGHSGGGGGDSGGGSGGTISGTSSVSILAILYSVAHMDE